MFATTFTDVQLFGSSYAEPEHTSSIRDDYGFNLSSERSSPYGFNERSPSPQPAQSPYYYTSPDSSDSEHEQTTSIYLPPPYLPVPTRTVVTATRSAFAPLSISTNNVIEVAAGFNVSDDPPKGSGIVNQAWNSYNAPFVFDTPPNLPPTSPPSAFTLESTIDDELTSILTGLEHPTIDIPPTQSYPQPSPSPYSSASSTPANSVPATPTSPYPFSPLPFGNLSFSSSNVAPNPYTPPTPTTLPRTPSTSSTLHPNYSPHHTPRKTPSATTQPPSPHTQQHRHQPHRQPNNLGSYVSNTVNTTLNHTQPTTLPTTLPNTTTTTTNSLNNSNGGVQINVRTTTNAINRFSVGFNKEFNNTREFSFVNCNPDPNNKKRRGDNSDRVNYLEQEIKELKDTVKKLLEFLSTFADSTRQCPSCSSVIANQATTIVNGYYNNNGSNHVSPRRPVPPPTDFQQPWPHVPQPPYGR